MKKVLITAALVTALAFVPVLAQENKDMPMKGPMPMHEGIPMNCGMDMEKMADMHKRMAGMDMSKMAEMHKRMHGMMGMMKMKGDMTGTKQDVERQKERSE